MSLGTNKRSMSNGSKTLLLSYWNGKYSVSYQHGTQKYIIKNDIDDEGYANYIFDQLYEDIFKNEFFNNNQQTINDIEKIIVDIKSYVGVLYDDLSYYSTNSNKCYKPIHVPIYESLDKLKQLVEKLK